MTTPTIGDRVLVDGFPFGERPGTLVEITPDAVVGDGPMLWVILDPTLDDLVAGIGDEDLEDPIPFRPEQVRDWR